MPPRELFLSHSSQDREAAERLVKLLQDHGIAVFYSPQNIVGSQQWQNEILAALERCDWFAVLLSPNAVQSMWVQRECAFAFQEPRFNNCIVPILFQECDLGPMKWLRIWQMVNISTDFGEGCRQLLRIWGLGLKESAPPP
jgi:hypothetical protein